MAVTLFMVYSIALLTHMGPFLEKKLSLHLLLVVLDHNDELCLVLMRSSLESVCIKQGTSVWPCLHFMMRPCYCKSDSFMPEANVSITFSFVVH